MSFSSESSSSSSEEEDDEQQEHNNTIVLHMDVDYFYCQCEELDGQDRDRPIAVGQKHIIVTCNYVARSYGVQKLQLKTEALRACPSLLIVDGSNLERYRRYSRDIYTVFRQEAVTTSQQYGVSSLKVCKGGMDEVFMDMTALVDAALKSNNNSNKDDLQLPPSAFVYGNINTATKIVIKEDQSGAQSVLQDYNSSLETSLVVNGQQQRLRLHVAAAFAEQLRTAVRFQTGFSTTMGISTSPMLAKLTSDLKKPDSLNVLYPWRASNIVLPMPLRKVPQLGSGTLKALQPCLQALQGNNNRTTGWTCRDLLSVPRNEVLACLQTMNMNNHASEALCDELLLKCQGVDRSCIQDDSGGLAKTVSVENSFRRNTVRTSSAVWRALEDLFWRLPQLLDDRRACSEYPAQCFPTTIRLTAAVVDKRIEKRRPFVTRSKQCSVDGKSLMVETSQVKRSDILRKAVTPLINALVLNNTSVDMNIVRLNVAVTGFQDLQQQQSVATSPWAAFTTNETNSKRPRKRHRPQDGAMSQFKSLVADQDTRSPKARSYDQLSSSEEVDPAVLAELPADIRSEVCRTYGTKDSSRRTIDQFFTRKK